VFFIHAPCFLMCMMFYVFLIWIYVYAFAIHFMFHCGSALEPGASGRPYYCTSIWVRSWCNWRASFVYSKKKKTKDIIPATLSLLPLRGAAVGRAPTILPIDWFCTNFSSFSILHLFQPLGSWCKQTNNWSASCVCVYCFVLLNRVWWQNIWKKKGSANRFGRFFCGLPYYCALLVCVPAGGLAVWRHPNLNQNLGENMFPPFPRRIYVQQTNMYRQRGAFRLQWQLQEPCKRDLYNSHIVWLTCLQVRLLYLVLVFRIWVFPWTN